MATGTLHLLNAPITAPAPAFSLMPLPGVTSLSSLDRAPSWDRNMAQAIELTQQFRAALEAAHLPDWLQTQGLPPVDPMRMRYNRILIECVLLSDLLTRLPALLNQQQPQRLKYFGPADWKVEAVKAICQRDGIAVEWQPARDGKVALKESLRPIKDFVLDLRDRKRSRSQLKNSTADFLVFTSSSRFFLALSPALEQLAADTIVVEERKDMLAHSQFQPVRLEAWRPLNRLRSASIEAALRDHLERGLNDDSIIWNGIRLDATARVLITKLMKGIITEIQSVDALLETYPHALVVGTPVVERLLEVARARSRKIAVVQTCGICEYELVLPGEGHYVLCSNADVDYLADLGLAREQLEVCGHAYYDKFTHNAVSGHTVRKRLKVVSDNKLVLIVDNYAAAGLLEEETREDWFRTIYRGLKELENVVLVVKQHPFAKDEAFHRRLVAEAGVAAERLHIVREGAIADLIAACDMMVMMGSTVGMEAVLLDKPMIDVPYTQTDYFGYHITGATLIAHTSAEVLAQAQAILFNAATQRKLAEGRRAYRERFLHAQDGLVAQRIAQTLKRLHGHQLPPETRVHNR
ncbi:MAG: hypothetical protein JWN98_425 [Abditibacteriota bacterium]|nr:hypothetical protein [Abditibacteriota bacterium]